MKIVLVHPPQATFFAPYLAIPALTAALIEAGHKVTQIDANLLCNLHMLSPEYLSTFADPVLVEKISSAITGLRTLSTYHSVSQIRDNYAILDEAYEAISARFAPTEISCDLNMSYNPFVVSQLFSAVRDKETNPYLDLFREHILPRIIEQRPQLVGIGIAFESQLIPGVTLARLIKEVLPDCKIVVGGNIITKIHTKLLELNIMLEAFDFAIIGEGETPLCLLAEALEKGADLNGVPNLLRQVDGQVQLGKERSAEDLNLLPTPVFNLDILDDYLLPIRLIPTLTSRGCYWGRCAFCTHRHGYGKFRQRPKARLLQDIKILSETCSSSSFFLADEAVPPKQVRILSEFNASAEKPVSWFGDVRFEKVMLREDYIKDLVQSGCRMLAFGLESASQVVLDRIDKGGNPGLYSAVLKLCKEHEIFTIVMFFSGFPGETLAQAHETLRFVQNNFKYIDGWGNGAFSLQGGSAVFYNPESYGVTDIRKPEGLDLAEYYDYEVSSGLTQSSASQISQSIKRVREGDPKYAVALPREVTFARLLQGEGSVDEFVDNS